jgi:hypothetical protein
MGRVGSGLRTACFAVAAVVALVPQAGAQNALKVVFPTPPQTFMIPYLIPKDTGWYEKQGLKVDEVYVNGDSTAGWCNWSNVGCRAGASRRKAVQVNSDAQSNDSRPGR